MESLFYLIKEKLHIFFKENYDGLDFEDFQFRLTNREHNGNITLLVFPLAKSAKTNPDVLAGQIGEFLIRTEYISDYEVIKGFLNLNLSIHSWDILINDIQNQTFKTAQPQKIVLEYCGPNTNKPLHIGHLRNMFLGYAVAEILREIGHEVHKVNIFNDRGIAICKSMYGYLRYGNGTTPEIEKLKEDFFVGQYYILFSQELKAQAAPLIAQGIEKEKAENQTEIMSKANELLVKWEAGDKETIDLWNRMNQWFYNGVNQTYKRLGIDSEKDYFESKEYKKGKEIVEIGYEKGVFQKDESGAIYIDLTDKGLDKKYLQRSNGTSIYITQDMALVKQRFEDYKMDRMIYVVGDEQNYHFKVLKHIMEAMNEPFSSDIFHLSYGLVTSKDGTKFKSRDGTAADADLIMDMVVDEAKEQTLASGKAESMSENELTDLSEVIGLGALKYAMLKVASKKNMVFDPKEAVDLNGDTGVFIQYCFVRTNSVLKKWAGEIAYKMPDKIEKEEQNLIIQLASYHATIHRASEALDPSEIALYTLDLAKIYNRFYNELNILKEQNQTLMQFRLYLTQLTYNQLGKCLKIMGISAPERM